MFKKWIKVVLGCVCLVFIAGCATTPESEGDSGFPIGAFVSATDDTITLGFREDGNGYRGYASEGAGDVVHYKYQIKYAVNGNLYTEMTFEGPGFRPKTPATYYWSYDGETLSFTRWSDDERPTRRETYEDHTYIRKE